MNTKTMKTLLFSMFFMTFSLMSFDVIAEPEKGPTEKLLDCADVCVAKYEPWTLRRSSCAWDCYLIYLSDVAKLFTDVIVDGIKGTVD